MKAVFTVTGPISRKGRNVLAGWTEEHCRTPDLLTQGAGDKQPPSGFCQSKRVKGRHRGTLVGAGAQGDHTSAWMTT